MIKAHLRTIAILAILALTGLAANAQSEAVDKVAQLDDVYNYYIPEFMIKGIEKMGGSDILKATPIPSGLLKKVKSIQFVLASKKKAVKKAQKILKELDDTRKFQVLFRSSSNKEQKVVVYGFPARSEVFNEVILLINEHDRQLTLFQLLGEFSLEDINDIEEELKDDNIKNDNDEDVIVIDANQH